MSIEITMLTIENPLSTPLTTVITHRFFFNQRVHLKVETRSRERKCFTSFMGGWSLLPQFVVLKIVSE